MGKRKTEDDYHALAKSRGFLWVGPMPKTTSHKSLWQCPKEHRWLTGYRNIHLNFSGCHECAKMARRKTKKGYHDLAQRKGFFWLGKNIPTVEENTLWVCEHGHEKYTSYHNMKRIEKCEVCFCSNSINGKRASKPQIAVAEMLNGIVNHKESTKYIDVALYGEQIAIEYDCYFWHGHKVQEDLARTQELINAGWNVITIRANTLVPTKEQLDILVERAKIETHVIFTMKDWGKGNLAVNVGMTT